MQSNIYVNLGPLSVFLYPGQISLEEFVEGAQQDPWVMEQLKLNVRPSGWFNERNKT